MSKTVFCKKYQKELPALTTQPLPGEVGQAIVDSVSAQAWQDWLTHQTRLINEKQLELFKPEAQAYLNEQREKFLNNEDADQPEGYKPV